MKRVLRTGWLLIAVLVLAGGRRAAAHELHDHSLHEHNLAGIVAIVDGTRLHVQRDDQSHVVVTLEKGTKYRVGKEGAGVADLVVGRRVSVSYRDYGSEKRATQVRLEREASRAQAGAANPHSPRP